MTNAKKLEKLAILVLVIIIFIISGTIYINLNDGTEILLDNSAEVIPTAVVSINTEAVNEQAEEKSITAYICGYVNNPGNVTVPEGTRLGDALKLVGGALGDADLNVVNLAHRLSDEEMVYIPKKGEILDEKKDVIPGSDSSYILSKKPGKVNINKASSGELEALPGIGPSTAQKIINYRNTNGRFTTIEDIMNVPGIGEKKFESLKDFITI